MCDTNACSSGNWRDLIRRAAVSMLQLLSIIFPFFYVCRSLERRFRSTLWCSGLYALPLFHHHNHFVPGFVCFDISQVYQMICTVLYFCDIQPSFRWQHLVVKVNFIVPILHMYLTVIRKGVRTGRTKNMMMIVKTHGTKCKPFDVRKFACFAICVPKPFSFHPWFHPHLSITYV